ncbi:hypothetical protein BDV95DRAFT_475691, partial [Massariosphaeria phaeospora]
LGLFEMIPREVRHMIYALAIETDRPVKLRKCCGSSGKARRDCPNHGFWATDATSRFTLLAVSRGIGAEASWVIYSGCTLRLELENELAAHFTDAYTSSAARDRKWESAARYRHIELILPGQIVQFTPPLMYTYWLDAAVARMVDHWARNANEPTDSERALRHVTIHLGRMFSESLPFN